MPGRVDAVDCAELPCILYGRLEGDEADWEHVERAAALAPYKDDVMTALMWVATDDAARERDPRGPGREQALFAVAFYSREARAQHGDNLDRRIRSRTAELWNVLRPDDR